jgi:hypothetical protein
MAGCRRLAMAVQKSLRDRILELFSTRNWEFNTVKTGNGKSFFIPLKSSPASIHFIEKSYPQSQLFQT